MLRVELLAGSGLWVGLLIGFWTGVGFQIFRRAMQDYRKTKESLPSLKRTMRDTRRRATSRIFVLAGAAALALIVVVNAIR
jgi:Trk-type K+ transport system membrane component